MGGGRQAKSAVQALGGRLSRFERKKGGGGRGKLSFCDTLKAVFVIYKRTDTHTRRQTDTHTHIQGLETFYLSLLLFYPYIMAFFHVYGGRGKTKDD